MRVTPSTCLQKKKGFFVLLASFLLFLATIKELSTLCCEFSMQLVCFYLCFSFSLEEDINLSSVPSYPLPHFLSKFIKLHLTCS